MRQFFVMASLVFVTACGGPPNEQTATEPSVSEEAPTSGSATADDVSAASVTPGPGSCGLLPPRECFCAQYKTAATCNASGACVWNYNCQPTYE
ncbi:hypothetical protein [Pyxidicoccus caerfyrddinensis]|uniref:hypothetical protein n=1 Tax=Pyxidicoccus caerfyrddinensis TaxID=2709663 RepID=UPI0013DA048C|nr:hypothetical protein [Pyxidicoccus caerfyrddinensis]